MGLTGAGVDVLLNSSRRKGNMNGRKARELHRRAEQYVSETTYRRHQKTGVVRAIGKRQNYRGLKKSYTRTGVAEFPYKLSGRGLHWLEFDWDRPMTKALALFDRWTRRMSSRKTNLPLVSQD